MKIYFVLILLCLLSCLLCNFVAAQESDPSAEQLSSEETLDSTDDDSNSFNTADIDKNIANTYTDDEYDSDDPSPIPSDATGDNSSNSDEPVPEITTNEPLIQYDPSIPRGLKVGLVGFQSDHAKSLLHNLLSQPNNYENSNTNKYKMFQSKSNITVTTFEADLLQNDPDDIISDISFVYLNKLLVLNTDEAIQRLTKAMSLVTKLKSKKCNNSVKKSLIVVAASPKEDVSKLIDSIAKILDDAWMLVDKTHCSGVGELTSMLDVQIISVSSSTSEVSSVALDTINGVFEKLDTDSRPISQLYASKQLIVKSKAIRMPKLVDFNVGALDEGMKQAFSLAKKAITDSVDKLNKEESAKKFVVFIDNLIDLSFQKLEEYAKANSLTNVDMMRMAKTNLRRQILSLLVIIYRNQIQLIRQKVVKEFNVAVTEDLEISVNLIEDYNRYKYEALNKFKTMCNALRPKGMFYILDSYCC